MLTIEAIPAFSDNYIWLIYHQKSKQAYVVDPGTAQPVLARLQELKLQLQGVLVTHWHPDHIGGIDTLQAQYNKSLDVFGPYSEHIPQVNHPLRENASIEVLGHNLQIWEVPGHTLDHICYVDQALEFVFCGDTLFAAGCGRMFEGTPEQMHTSLQRFKQLPNSAQIYCAHEYTLNNLYFAHAAEPDNTAIAQRLQQVSVMREQEQMTVPSNIGLEKQTNPFLRVTSSQEFAALRTWKDSF